MNNPKFKVEIRNNNTIADTFRCDDPGHECSSDCIETTSLQNTHLFDTEAEAMSFYEKTKASLRFAGSGIYVTYPTSIVQDLQRCDDCGRRIHSNHRFCSRCLAQWYAENDLDPSEVPNGDFDEPRRNEE